MKLLLTVAVCHETLHPIAAKGKFWSLKLPLATAVVFAGGTFTSATVSVSAATEANVFVNYLPTSLGGTVSIKRVLSASMAVSMKEWFGKTRFMNNSIILHHKVAVKCLTKQQL